MTKEQLAAILARMNQGGGNAFPEKAPDRTNLVLNYPGLEYLWEKLKTEGLGGLTEDQQAALSLLSTDEKFKQARLSNFYINASGHLISADGGNMVDLEVIDGRLYGKFTEIIHVNSVNVNDAHLFVGDTNTEEIGIKTLWENTDSTSAFAAQTVFLFPLALNLTKVDYLLIKSRWYSSEDYFTVNFLPTSGAFIVSAHQRNNSGAASRKGTVSGAIISFEAALRGTATDNKYLIPDTIYGITL